MRAVFRHGMHQLPMHDAQRGMPCDGAGSLGAPVVQAQGRDLGPGACLRPDGDLDLSALDKVLGKIFVKHRKDPPISSRHFVQTNACALGLNCMVFVKGRRGAVKLHSMSIPWARLGELVVQLGRVARVEKPVLDGWMEIGKSLDF